MHTLFKLTIVLLFGFFLGACTKTQVQLPQVEQTVEQTVEDYSEIFIFFDESNLQAQLNKNNLITSTNWVFHIDKRNTLANAGYYIEQMQFQKKNPQSPHSNPNSQNYFSVAQGQTQKALGFINFTQTEFKAYDFSILENSRKSPIFVGKRGCFYQGKEQELSYFYHFATSQDVLWIFDGTMLFDDFMRIYSLLKANNTNIAVVYYKK